MKSQIDIFYGVIGLYRCSS